MKLSLRVNVEGMYYTYAACVELSELQQECFEPMKTGDTPLISGMVGEIGYHEARTVMKTREDAAEVLAKDLAKLIVDAMKKNDTHNGYEVN